MAVAPSVLTCPTCHKKFKGKPELAGKKIKCPLCGEPFVVPKAAADGNGDGQAAAKPEGAYQPAAVEAYGVEKLDDTYKCPNCAKPMASEDAIVCVFCGYNTLTREHGKTKKLVAHTKLEHFLYLFPALSAAVIFFLLVLLILFFNLVISEWVVGSPKAEWLAHESVRMWSAFLLLDIMWFLGVYAFNTLALMPRPPEVEKEDVKA